MQADPIVAATSRANRFRCGLAAVVVAFAPAGCTTDVEAPANAAPAAFAWGPETPHFNLEAILRGDGFGLVKFRQPNDDDFTVFLDVWVRDLAPNTSHVLQRAVDTQLDGQCVNSGWLTLGHGLSPHAIQTDVNGTGRASLFRNLPAVPGATFDIHFRVIVESTGSVVLESACYRFTISA